VQGLNLKEFKKFDVERCSVCLMCTLLFAISVDIYYLYHIFVTIGPIRRIYIVMCLKVPMANFASNLKTEGDDLNFGSTLYRNRSQVFTPIALSVVLVRCRRLQDLLDIQLTSVIVLIVPPVEYIVTYANYAQNRYTYRFIQQEINVRLWTELLYR